MKRFLLLFVLVLTVCSTAMAQQNYDFENYVGTINLHYKIIDEEKHCVCIVPPSSYISNVWLGHSLPKGEIELPETVTHNGTTYTVTGIGACAFYFCDELTGSLTIPNTVTYIGREAFKCCSGFTGSLIIPNSVTSIGVDAFNGCSGFTGSLTIPNSMTSIEIGVFLGCSGFNGSLTIPNSVKSIGVKAFSGCSGFTGSLIIPNSVESIDYNAFQGCSGFTGDLIISNSVKSIDANTFEGCSGFKGSLTIGSSVETIGTGAFRGCSGFTGDLNIPNSVKVIDTYAFQNAFQDCSGFTGNLNIPNSVESIGNCAFDGCKGFKGSLTIGSSVKSIGFNAFSGCSGFTGDLIIPNSVTSIDVEAFSGCSGFTGSLIIGNSLESIANYAFSGCSGFKGDLIISNSVKSIGDNAFEGSFVYINSLTIGSSVESIGIAAFKGCGGFRSLTIPNSVKNINGRAFQGCVNFHGSLTIPNSVTFIGPYAFDGCDGIMDLTIGSSVKTIDKLAFQGCQGVTNIKVKPGTPPRLSNSDAFNGMLRLKTITVPYGCGEAYKTEKTWTSYAGMITEDIVYDLTVTSSNTDLGTVSITQDATCENNGQATVTATLAEKYLFMNWTEDGKVVSTDNPYTFTLKNDCNLVANFYYTATCTTGQTLYYRIIDAEKHWISIAAPNGDDANGWNGFTKPEGAITLPETIIFNGTSYTVTAIDDYAFCNCEKLTGLLAIPKSVTSIGNHAFDGCSGFTGIKAKPATPPTLGDDAFVGMSELQTITVPYDKVDVYKASWSDYAEIIEGGIVYDLTVTSSDTDLGTASITQDATCENNGQVTVTATPAGTNWFAGWTENGKLVSTDNPYTFTLTSDRNLVANFPSTETVSYIDADGQEKTVDAVVVENYITTLCAGWYVVSSTDVQTTTLTCDGEVHLILADGAKLTVTGTDYQAGIQVSGTGNSLTIYGQAAQSGQLFAKGGYYGAGIGGGWGASGSNITINGGVITATGSQGGAGIGGGAYGNGSNITINGGVITATGSGYGAGIGGGEDFLGSNITINGGTVTANGGQNASGIGGGEDKSGSNFIFASNIKVDIHSLIKANGSNPPTTVISNTGADLASSLAGKRYVTITEVFNITANQDPNNKANYYSTFYSGKKAYSVPEGVTAYTGAVDGDVLRLTAIEGGIIPAGEAVILRLTTEDNTATKKQFDLTAMTTTATKSGTNALKGTDVATTLSTNDYALSLGQNGVGFYLWEGKEIAAHKAYLTLESPTMAKAFTFMFDDGETTAIEQPAINGKQSGDTYNLNGVRVNDNYKGIVIKNGKKVYQK